MRVSFRKLVSIDACIKLCIDTASCAYRIALGCSVDFFAIKVFPVIS